MDRQFFFVFCQLAIEGKNILLAKLKIKKKPPLFKSFDLFFAEPSHRQF